MLILNELHRKYEQVSVPAQGYGEMSPLVEEYTYLPYPKPSPTDPVPSIYTSAPSRFIVDGKSLYIHGQLVSRHSKPLSAKINARKDYIIIDDVDKDTFVRFVEWAYKGYYTAAEYQIDAELPSLSKFEDSDTCTPEAEPGLPAEVAPEPLAEPIAEAIQVEEPAPAIDEIAVDWAFGMKKNKKTKKQAWDWDTLKAPSLPPAPQSSKTILQAAFYARKETVREDFIRLPQPRQNQSPNENYIPTFLSHAHLYIFACKYGIPPLKTLALENLHTTLKEFTLHPERTGDVIELLRYIYSSSSREFKDGGAVGCGDMREMLKGYIGFQMDVLMKDREFRGLMKEEGELLDDFVEMVGKRI